MRKLRVMLISLMAAALSSSRPAYCDSPYEVDDHRPEAPAKAQALNLAPSPGAEPFGMYGYAWLHILDTDNRVNPNFGMAHLGINKRDVVLGSLGIGTVEPKPIAVQFDQIVGARFTPTELQIPKGRIVITPTDNGVVLDVMHRGINKGSIIVDEKGARFKNFKHIEDIEARLLALEKKLPQ